MEMMNYVYLPAYVPEMPRTRARARGGGDPAPTVPSNEERAGEQQGQVRGRQRRAARPPQDQQLGLEV